jgi:hypothetical protein
MISHPNHRKRTVKKQRFSSCLLCGMFSWYAAGIQYTTQPSLAAASGPTNYKLAPNQKMGGQILGWMVILIERGGGGREGGNIFIHIM